MTEVKIRHYVVKRSKGFWQPTKKMRAVGFGPVPCGIDGPDAWTRAEEWNRRWDQTRSGGAPSPAMASAQNLSFENSEEFTVYPSRSLGEAFRKYRRTEEWSRKAPRTREDWWRGWKRIKPVFGDCDPRTVRLDDVSAWRKAIEDTVSLREAHRALKIWRALWKVSAALGYCIRDARPIACRPQLGRTRARSALVGRRSGAARQACMAPGLPRAGRGDWGGLGYADEPR